MSDTSSVRLMYIEEWEEGGAGTYGTTPSTPTLQTLRFESETFKPANSYAAASEIRGDSNVTDNVRTSSGGTGGFSAQLTYATYDAFLEAILLSADWTSPVTVISGSVSVGFTASTQTIALDTGVWTNTPTAGEWIRVSGAGTAGNNGLMKVASATTTTVVVSGEKLTDEGAAATVTITQGSMIANGTTLRSFVFEREYVDVSSEFAVYNGQVASGWNLQVPQEGILTTDFSFLGMQEVSGTSTIRSGLTAANTNPILNAGTDFTKWMEGGGTSYTPAAAGGPYQAMTGFSLSVVPNIRLRKQPGTVGPVSAGRGRVIPTGTVQMYFASKALADKHLNDNDSAIAVAVTDAASQAYVIELPEIKYTDATRVATGPDDDVILDLPWAAHMDATESRTMAIWRFATP